MIEFAFTFASAAAAVHCSLLLLRAWMAHRDLVAATDTLRVGFTKEVKQEIRCHLQQLQEQIDYRATPISAWRNVQVARIVDESPTCKSFYLVDPTLERLPRFHGGQHIVMELRPPTETKSIRRCYSLSASPEFGFWRITVRRDRRGSSSSISHVLHDQIKVGDTLRVKGPQGDFTYASLASRPTKLIAAGIGITPLLGMLYEWAGNRSDIPVQLYYQVHSAKDLPFREELQRLSDSHPNLKVHYYVSGANSDAVDASIHRTPMSVNDILAEVRDDSWVYVLCGPSPWMTEIISELSTRGIGHDRILFESFGGFESHLPRARSDASARLPPPKVTLLRSAQTVACDQEGCNLLDLARSQGAPIDSGCRAGNCGSCLTKLLSGEVIYSVRPQCDHAEDEVVMCVAHPASDLVLDL